MRSFLLFVVAATFSLSVAAKPSPETAREVIDYYFNGQEQGIVLADIKLCEDVYGEGESKNECKNELKPNALEKNKPFMVWMMFMVPSGMDPQEVMVQLNHGGMTMDVETARVASSVRYRIWRKVSLDRTGKWTIKIAHDDGQNINVLDEFNVEVKEAPAE